MDHAQRLMQMLDLHLSSGHIRPSAPSAEEEPVEGEHEEMLGRPKRAQMEFAMRLANASVGNLLLTALRLSLGSLEVSQCPSEPEFEGHKPLAVSAICSPCCF